MKKLTYAFVAGASLLAAGCKDSTAVYPVDTPPVEALQAPLLPGALQSLAVGVVAADRQVFAGTGSAYPIIANIYSRDFYRIDPSESRYVNETLGGTADPGSFAGGGAWTGPYTAIRASNTMLAALKNLTPDVFTTQQVQAAQGYARTFKALDYYRVAELRDTVGLAIQKEDPTDLTPGPLVCKTSGLTFIAALLDTANTDLTTALAAGQTQFSFTLPPGFSNVQQSGRDYRQLANFIRFNRGQKGKVDFYRALDHQAPKPALLTTALAELTQALGGAAPGAVPATQFGFGPYHVFVPSGTEGVANPYSDRRLRLNPQVKDSILPTDTRSSKIIAASRATAAAPAAAITSNITARFAVASTANQSRPISLLRDEELVLLRAQVYFELGQFANGYLDLNSVHTAYGNPAWDATNTNLETARSNVLYDKRYSLLGEGVQRLVDLRAYGRFKLPYIAKAVPNDPYNQALPIPKAEADARGGRDKLTPSCS